MEYYSSYNSTPYPESDESSPLSREIDFENTNPPPWDDDRSQNSNSNNQPPPVKLMCSFGGKIQPRPNDNQLSYVGGHTKILAVDRGAKFASLLAKLAAMCDSDVKMISFKYQLPGEDLDALISVTDDEDLDHMMHEHDRLSSRVSNHKPARVRIFIFPMVHDPSLGSSSEGQVKSEKERFVEALNSAPIMAAPQSAAGNVDFLSGLEKSSADPAAAVVTGVVDERFGGLDPIQKHIQDLHRLRIEEERQQQEGMYRRRKSDDNLGGSGGEYYNKLPEKAPPPPLVPMMQQVPGGGLPYSTVNNNIVEQAPPPSSVYLIPGGPLPPPASAYHSQMVRPSQGYYTVPQAHMYNMMPPQPQQAVASMAAAPPTMAHQQKPVGYSEGYGMVRPVSPGGGGVTELGGYGQMAYDSSSGVGRQQQQQQQQQQQVIYTAPASVMGAPLAPLQTAALPSQYHHNHHHHYQQAAMAGMAGGGGDMVMRTTPGTGVVGVSVGVTLNPETGGKVKVNQPSI